MQCWRGWAHLDLLWIANGTIKHRLSCIFIGLGWMQLIVDVIDEYLRKCAYKQTQPIQTSRWREGFGMNRKSVRRLEKCSRKMWLLKSLACHGSLLSILYVYSSQSIMFCRPLYVTNEIHVEFVVSQNGIPFVISLFPFISIHFFWRENFLAFTIFAQNDWKANKLQESKKEPKSEINFTYVLVSPRQLNQVWWRWLFLLVKILFIHSKLIHV